MYRKINCCRLCKSKNIVDILTLGRQKLTGIFPKKNKINKISSGPLSLILCKKCGLVQLKHSYNLEELYGSNYGYRSGLNNSMVDHLKNKVSKLEKKYKLKKNDVVIDIGSNDATLLNSYSSKNLKKIGIDPTIKNFTKFYKKDTLKINNFFDYETLNNKYFKRAKIITSIAMFYDLEDPNKFVADIYKSLDDSGIWHFEQSYMPLMLNLNSYDTICHEHLEYYSLNVVKNLLESNNLKILDVEFNQINGGSFAVTAAKKNSNFIPNHSVIKWILNNERKLNLLSIKTYKKFEKNIQNHRMQLQKLLKELYKSGKTIIGYGASTKGNVILQYCKFNDKLINCIAEINEKKFNCYTPGSNIKIVDAKKLKNTPDYMLVLPWHFRDNIINKEREFIRKGGKLIFPLPEIEIY